MAQNRQAQTGLVLRTYSADQVFSLESLDSTAFDRLVAAVNKGDRQVAQTVYNTLAEKRAAGYIFTPLTDELYSLAQAKLGRQPRQAH